MHGYPSIFSFYAFCKCNCFVIASRKNSQFFIRNRETLFNAFNARHYLAISAYYDHWLTLSLSRLVLNKNLVLNETQKAFFIVFPFQQIPDILPKSTTPKAHYHTFNITKEGVKQSNSFDNKIF